MESNNMCSFLCISRWHFLMLSCIPFVYPFTSWVLGCFHFGTIMNKAILFMHAFVWTCLLFPWGKCLEGILLSHIMKCVFNLIWKRKTKQNPNFQNGYCSFHSYSNESHDIHSSIFLFSMFFFLYCTISTYINCFYFPS